MTQVTSKNCHDLFFFFFFFFPHYMNFYLSVESLEFEGGFTRTSTSQHRSIQACIRNSQRNAKIRMKGDKEK